MSIKCLLGLVACLNYEGTYITGKTAFGMLDHCSMIKNFSVDEFDYDGGHVGRGFIHAELLQEEGLKFEFDKDASPAELKNIVLKECRALNRIYYDDLKWKQ